VRLFQRAEVWREGVHREKADLFFPEEDPVGTEGARGFVLGIAFKQQS